jgi:hypothetical protein
MEPLRVERRVAAPERCSSLGLARLLNVPDETLKLHARITLSMLAANGERHAAAIARLGVDQTTYAVETLAGAAVGHEQSARAAVRIVANVGGRELACVEPPGGTPLLGSVPWVFEGGDRPVRALRRQGSYRASANDLLLAVRPTWRFHRNSLSSRWGCWADSGYCESKESSDCAVTRTSGRSELEATTTTRMSRMRSAENCIAWDSRAVSTGGGCPGSSCYARTGHASMWPHPRSKSGRPASGPGGPPGACGATWSFAARGGGSASIPDAAAPVPTRHRSRNRRARFGNLRPQPGACRRCEGWGEAAGNRGELRSSRGPGRIPIDAPA